MASVSLGVGTDLTCPSYTFFWQKEREVRTLDQQRRNLKQAHGLQTNDDAGCWGKNWCTSVHVLFSTLTPMSRPGSQVPEAEENLELLILLSLPPGCWCYGCVSPYPIFMQCNRTQGLVHPTQAPTKGTTATSASGRAWCMLKLQHSGG